MCLVSTAVAGVQLDEDKDHVFLCVVIFKSISYTTSPS